MTTKNNADDPDHKVPISSDEFHVREPEKRDLPAMIELLTRTQTDHFERQPHIFCKAEDKRVIRKYFSHVIKRRFRWKHQNLFGLVVENGNEFAGYLIYHFIDRPGLLVKAETLYWVYDIAVTPKYEGTGAAALLLEKLKENVDQEAINAIECTVWAGNERSRTFFEKQGFKKLSENFRFAIDE